MSRPLLSQREAAAACGVSRSTIRRRREAGGLPGCVQDDERGWLIPVEALLAVGFRLRAPAPAEDASAPAKNVAARTRRPRRRLAGISRGCGRSGSGRRY
ncbi:helix-turn-helix transcriptional regulator [Streptomyces sp. NPDC014773]|uniref:helix-turn-helix transcriptional regulator n=1 Tax=Streptomyces sp. NPDC014773 TaxID=3364908 RepID=UPI0036FCE3E7